MMNKATDRSQPLPELYPASVASRMIGVSRTTFYKLRAEGRLAVVKIGGRNMVDRREIERVLTEGTKKLEQA